MLDMPIRDLESTQVAAAIALLPVFPIHRLVARTVVALTLAVFAVFCVMMTFNNAFGNSRG